MGGSADGIGVLGTRSGRDGVRFGFGAARRGLRRGFGRVAGCAPSPNAAPIQFAAELHQLFVPVRDTVGGKSGDVGFDSGKLGVGEMGVGVGHVEIGPCVVGGLGCGLGVGAGTGVGCPKGEGSEGFPGFASGSGASNWMIDGNGFEPTKSQTLNAGASLK